MSCQQGGSTSVSLCELVSLGTDESAPPRGTENPRVGNSILHLAVRSLDRPDSHLARGLPPRGNQPAFCLTFPTLLSPQCVV